MKKILLLDNYDSFTYNLYHLVKNEFKGVVEVLRDTDIKLDNISQYDALIISPGPGRPETTPTAMLLIEKLYNKVPILGICLGMQCLNEFFGGLTIKGKKPIHGKVSRLTHNDELGIFKNIPQNINIARYHSLEIKILNDDISIIGKTENDIVMAIKHKRFQIYGLQFHPESFLSEYGNLMINNFLRITNII